LAGPFTHEPQFDGAPIAWIQEVAWFGSLRAHDILTPA